MSRHQPPGLDSGRRAWLKFGTMSAAVFWLPRTLFAAAPVQLSSIYHFKGKLGRCSGFHGMGTDNRGNCLAWGTPTTDYSYMAGEYWAARQAQEAVFAHT
jgi:hypothetical protein